MSDSSRIERPAFLGVEHSLTGKRWATRLGDERQALLDFIPRRLGAQGADM